MSRATPRGQGLHWVALSVLLIAPIVLSAYYLNALWNRETFRATADTLEEGELVETLTFIVFLLATVVGFWLVARLKKVDLPGFVFWFYLLFSIGMLFCMMEEIAWGQKLFDFDIPDRLRNLNAQGDLTLHNVHALQGHSEYFRVAFAVGGLIGLVLYCFPGLSEIAVPPVLWVWFVLIAVFSAVDLYLDYTNHGKTIYLVFGKEMSEVVELMIALASLLYLGLNTRRILGTDRSASRF